MLDRSTFWAASAVPQGGLSGQDITVRLLPALPQIMVSGDLDGALAGYGIDRAQGLLGQVRGDLYALRLARSRMLVVGAEMPDPPLAWSDGVARSPMTGALAVIEIAGAHAMDLVARGTSVDPASESPCAALNFAGVTSVLYRHDDALRLHFDRGLAAYMFDWIGATDLFA